MIKKSFVFILCVICFIEINVFAISQTAENPSSKAVERFAVYVGSNRGGNGRENLRYAGSDAQKIATAMLEVGGLKYENSHILVDPSKADIERLFSIVSSDLINISGSAKRTEFLFYYSGHSDENALLLGEERYSYSDLKAAIASIPSEIHVVMLDSCFSGNFIRAKGGQRQKSFLIDDSSVVQGHAYLSSSSASESSQESDAIGASFFTNSLVTGLRGAADTSGDNKVSLNELYYYAFNDTLYNTEDSVAGPQHPSFNITLVGSGDLVLTDISEAEAVLVLPNENTGRFLIRNESGTLVSEVSKTLGSQIVLALPVGHYSVMAVTPNETLQSDVTLLPNFPVTLRQSKMVSIGRQKNTLRGDAVQNNSYETDLEADSEKKSGFTNKVTIQNGEYGIFHFNIIPSLQYPKEPSETNILSAALITTKDKNIMGIQWSFIVSSIENSFIGWQHTGIAGEIKGTGYGFQNAGLIAKCADFYGVQSGGIANISKDLTGIQMSGIFNKALDVYGGLFSGIFNMSNSLNGLAIAGVFNWTTDATGWQIAGILNKSDDLTGVQTAGVINIADEVHGVQIASVLNIADSVEGVQLGVVNYANECKGLPIGLINIIPNCILEAGVYLDSDRNMAVQYQGGTKYLFTTIVVGTKDDCSYDYGFYGLGLGSRINIVKKVSVDIEGLWKDYFDENKDSSDISYLPALRLTSNFSIVKHIKLFISGNVDMIVESWNDDFFDGYTQNYKCYSGSIRNTDVDLYGSIQAGVKFSLN